MKKSFEKKFRFGTVGAPIGTPKKPGGSIGAVEYSAKLDLRAFELGWVRSVRVTEKTCQDIRTTGVEQDVALSVHASYFINLNATKEEWPKSRQRLMDAAHFGNLAGATDIIFHPGSYFKESPDKVIPIVSERLGGLIAELEAAGNPVRLRPETMGKPAMIGSLEDMIALSRDLPGLEPCLDFAHLYARTGDESMNTYDEWTRLLEQYGKGLGQESLGRLHIHLSGIEFGPKGEKKHLPIEESQLDLDAILRALHDFKCAGRILIESPAMEEDALLVKKRWESL